MKIKFLADYKKYQKNKVIAKAYRMGLLVMPTTASHTAYYSDGEWFSSCDVESVTFKNEKYKLIILDEFFLLPEPTGS